MRLLDLFHETFSALASNKGRSMLTVLGIVIGIGAVIAMTALIGGIKSSMMGELGLEQARLVNINCWYGAGGMQEKDVDALAKEMSNMYEYVTCTNFGSSEATYGSEKKMAMITGVRPGYQEAMDVKLSQGRWFTDDEFEKNALKVVIDKTGVKNLFGKPDADVVGKSITIGQVQYGIIGVNESSQLGGYDGVTLIMPMGTVNTRINGYSSVDTVMGFAVEGSDMNAVKTATENWLAEHFNIPDDEREGSMWVQTMQSIIDEVNATVASFQMLMTSVAGISLVVGGIGIMNMMLTNVTERIREIGLRKALGARRRDITRQFLLESVVLCLAGGVIGILAGYFLAYVFTGLGAGVFYGEGTDMTITPVIDPQSVIIATAICVGIGVVFGYYPARRAAKLDPVECLHYQ